ncbi:MAG: CinA family protein [Bacillota bacterium]
METLAILSTILKKKQMTISTAESCTGGLLAAALTNIPGSSEYFGLGLVTYSNLSKVQLLGVNETTIEKYGAVSEKTAEEMAMGAKKLAKSDIGIAITGVAGPGGGTEEKPVGLVYVAVAKDNNIFVLKNNFEGDRNTIRKKTVIAAVEYLVSIINN